MDINLSFLERLKALFSGKVSRPETSAQIESTNKTTSDASIDNSAAINLISLLQKHGRLVDFIFENIDSYSDEEVGAGARIVHEGCKKVLNDYIKVSPIETSAEESQITIEEGFSPARVKLTGNLNSKPPFNGILIHRGWQVTEINLPELINAENANIICAAEVEVK